MLHLQTATDIATITLNRPVQRNALTQAMWRDLPPLMARLAADPTVKLVILTGAGGHFAAGADIGEFEESFATADSAAAYGALVSSATEAVAACPKPVLAQIEGACVGGACGLALACDIRIAAETARLGITPGKLGLAYNLPDTKRLRDVVGPAQAKLMLFTGRLLTAAQALAIGLVDQIVPAADLAASVLALAHEITAASQHSIRITKATLALIEAGTITDTDQTRAWFTDAAAAPDFAEGRAAFLAKRKPAFPMR